MRPSHYGGAKQKGQGRAHEGRKSEFGDDELAESLDDKAGAPGRVLGLGLGLGSGLARAAAIQRGRVGVRVKIRGASRMRGFEASVGVRVRSSSCNEGPMAKVGVKIRVSIRARVSSCQERVKTLH